MQMHRSLRIWAPCKHSMMPYATLLDDLPWTWLAAAMSHNAIPGVVPGIWYVQEPLSRSFLSSRASNGQKSQSCEGNKPH